MCMPHPLVTVTHVTSLFSQKGTGRESQLSLQLPFQPGEWEAGLSWGRQSRQYGFQDCVSYPAGETPAKKKVAGGHLDLIKLLDFRMKPSNAVQLKRSHHLTDLKSGLAFHSDVVAVKTCTELLCRLYRIMKRLSPS